MPTTTITDAQNAAADALLSAMSASAELVPDTCEGSAGHLRDDAVNEARTDLEYIRTDPCSPILALAEGGYLTMTDWLEGASRQLASWHKQD